MSWASEYIDILASARAVSFRPEGRSMEPIIFSGDEVTCQPPWGVSLLGKVVLCTVAGVDYLHIVKEVVDTGSNVRYLIGNAKGSINGWITIDSIHGVVTKVVR